MNVFRALELSSSGMTAERLRMDIIARNIANANATRTAAGTPYRRQMAVLSEKSSNFSQVLAGAIGRGNIGSGVEVSAIVEDKTPFKLVYNPGHPDANNEGYVEMPNVDTVTEMVNMISATRAYEANVTAVNSSKAMAMKALEIG